MRDRPKSESDPVNPTPIMTRGATEFEEAQIRRDFIAVFGVVSHAMFHSIQESHEYTYRAGFFAGKARRELSQSSNSPRYPSYITIL